MKKTWLFWDLPAEAVDAIRDFEQRMEARELELIEALLEAQAHGPLSPANHWYSVVHSATNRRSEIKGELELRARTKGFLPHPCTPVGQGDSCNGLSVVEQSWVCAVCAVTWTGKVATNAIFHDPCAGTKQPHSWVQR